MTSESNPEKPSTDAQTQPPSQSPMNQPAPQQKENGATQELAREFRTVEIIQIVINGALAIIGVVALSIYGGQLKEMKKTTEATRTAAIAARDGANTASETFKLTYRPRITITKIYPQENLDGGKRLAITFSVLNYGPITARNVRVFRFENVSDLEHASRQPYGKEPLRDYPKMLAPAKADDWGIYGENLSSQQIHSLARRDTLPITSENKQQIATFSVLVEYQGDFPETHHSEACILFALPPQRWWTYCPWPVQID